MTLHKQFPRSYVLISRKRSNDYYAQCSTYVLFLYKNTFFPKKICVCAFFVVPLQPISELTRSNGPDGGIGRRAGLKHQWSNPCRFDPGSGYKQKTQHYAGSFCLYPFSTPVSCADSPFQGHTAFRSRFSRASPLLRFSAKILLTRMTRR